MRLREKTDVKNLLIRKIELKDLVRVSEINHSAFGDYSYPFSLRQNFDLFRDSYQVATIKEDVVGFCLGAVKPLTNEGWILDMAVLTEKQGQGIGWNLLRATQDILQELGVKNLYLTVDPTKIEVVKFYEKIGFSPEREEKSYFGDGMDRIVMKARLS